MKRNFDLRLKGLESMDPQSNCGSDLVELT